MAKKTGRRKGSRNKGFFFRTGRGWFTKDNGQFVPLTDETGNRLRDRDTPTEVVKDSLARWRLSRSVVIVDQNDATVGDVCGAYLDHLKAQAGQIQTPAKGKAKTYLDRGQTLFDFCYGLPAEFFCGGDLEKRKIKIAAKQPSTIHSGFGGILCTKLLPTDIDAWIAAHSWSVGGVRTRVQAVKRAFNFGVERKLIEINPIRGYRVAKSQTRITYLSPKQEVAMVENASPAFAVALKVCIRTGARFGCEFASLTSKHIADHGDKMEWVFKPNESKTRKLRRILLYASTFEVLRRTWGLKAGGPNSGIFKSTHLRPEICPCLQFCPSLVGNSGTTFFGSMV